MEEQVVDIQTFQPFMGLGVGAIIFIIVAYVFLAYCLARIAVRTGMPFGSSFVWALIPIANVFLILKIAGKPMWWFILCLIPIVNFVITIIVWMAISERLGRPGWWGILIALVPVVNIVLFLILAFESRPVQAQACA